jgi:hypothetical protein
LHSFTSVEEWFTKKKEKRKVPQIILLSNNIVQRGWMHVLKWQIGIIKPISGTADSAQMVIGLISLYGKTDSNPTKNIYNEMCAGAVGLNRSPYY